MAEFTTGSMIQLTISDDTVYVSVDGNVLVRATAPIITLNMTQNHRAAARLTQIERKRAGQITLPTL